ncbi:hypothetical protein GCM10020358_66740 [Amorphoplanes nipponensis]|uniref:Gram-positive cocci surface proteins LPxTG domain-containing protein n=1 Tax=Actinoplanes nipponensis TaxID=135950 RepID=A0A919JLD3_9ACTN|nr:hypothetical protein [Actinoplanes nipponensis]GIE51788.1 hypothetical protein Ani05nite_53220 [Actinoplanes nipponensis]
MRRVLHRLLTSTGAVLLAAAAVAVPGTPALAADPAVRLHFPDVSVAGRAEKVNALLAWIDVPGDEPAQFGPLTVTVDTAGTADVATVELFADFEGAAQQSCDVAGTVRTCRISGDLELEPGPNLVPLLALSARARPGAATGATGKLAFTARLGAGPAATGQSTVTVGEGVDLAGTVAEPVTVSPGAGVDTDLRVTNAGENPVKGVSLVMIGWHPSLLTGPGFRNCTYGALIVCTFADELAPGASYQLSTPMRLKIPADAAAGSTAGAVGGWYTTSDFRELLDAAPGAGDEILGPQGTGPAVRLAVAPPRKPVARAAAGQVDTEPGNNLLVSEIVVGGRRPDLVAVGATVAGRAGEKVQARVGFRNDGPGTLYHWTFDNTDPGTHVTVPAGLEAVAVDDRCFPAMLEVEDPEDFDEDLAGAADYVCLLDEGRTKAKAGQLFDFTFRVREHASAAAGRVRINEEMYRDGDPIDRNGANDSAQITVALSGGEGGGLPVTGADTARLGAGGAALLLAGAAGLLLARRRRTRFAA